MEEVQKRAKDLLDKNEAYQRQRDSGYYHPKNPPYLGETLAIKRRRRADGSLGHEGE